ncbi:nucleotide sugar dehydrogenase [Acinetobacter larvae]|uniref:UDP-glucose 6-dehydrogenase n=1 Tax=Acinetobacter larvae TaxID=1789224 RepID=A0A1B2LVM8_9GAMM|nr:nucleotide sugar dehydrogenase [Acinetobacter larvae]AOA57002.1 UDP-glucose 6-dehydrogenase [Acinetobacter larvae]
MKIALYGNTLQAQVMAGLLAECGHMVYWYKQQECELHQAYQVIPDYQLNHLIHTQIEKGFLVPSESEQFAIDFDVYLLSFQSSAYQTAEQLLKTLAAHTAVAPKLIINGSTFGLQATLQLKESFTHTDWAYLPDMVQEGRAIDSFIQMQQVVIGVDSTQAQTLIQEIFRPIFPHTQQYLFMPILDAEFTKFSLSGMLATRISYMNDLALVAEKLGIDILNVRQGLAADTRIGASYLSPGCGFGGENFSHDILTLSKTVSKTGTQSRLLEQVYQINQQQKEILFRKLWIYYNGDLRDKTVAIWGAAFKENTSSIQNSPIHVMLAALWAQGVRVQLHDPEALHEIYAYYGQRDDLILCEQQYQATENADALCLMTAWKQYFSPDFKRLKHAMAHPYLLDGRNIYDPVYVRSQGFIYTGIGRL